MRLDIYGRMNRFVMEDIKPNFSAVASQYNVDRRTVKKAYERALKGEPAPTYHRKKRVSKLDDYKEMIDDKLEAGCTAKAIFRFIQKKGFAGGYTIVKDYCRGTKAEKTKKETIRVTHTIGLSAQVDWKESRTINNKNGVAVTVNIFLYVMPYSKRKYLQLTLDRKQDTLFECLYNAFQFMGGLPKEIWFDNMATVTDHARSTFSEHHFNERFKSFADDAGFNPIACRVYRPQTKGCVEALARTMSRLKPYDGEFETIAELSKIVQQVEEELNHEVSQGHNQVPEEVWQKEKEHLRPINPDLTRYFHEVTLRKVSKDSMVRFRNQQYSVSPHYIGKLVQVKPSGNGKQLSIYYEGALIRTYNITNQLINYHPDDYQAALKSDLMAERSDEEVTEYMNQHLSDYDNLGE